MSFSGKKVGRISFQIKNMATNFNPEHKEGALTTTIEEQTAKIPSDVFFVDSRRGYCYIAGVANNRW